MSELNKAGTAHNSFSSRIIFNAFNSKELNQVHMQIHFNSPDHFLFIKSTLTKYILLNQ